MKQRPFRTGWCNHTDISVWGHKRCPGFLRNGKHGELKCCCRCHREQGANVVALRPDDVSLSVSQEATVSLSPDGRVVLGPGATATDAGRKVWAAVQEQVSRWYESTVVPTLRTRIAFLEGMLDKTDPEWRNDD